MQSIFIFFDSHECIFVDKEFEMMGQAVRKMRRSPRETPSDSQLSLDSSGVSTDGTVGDTVSFFIFIFYTFTFSGYIIFSMDY